MSGASTTSIGTFSLGVLPTQVVSAKPGRVEALTTVTPFASSRSRTGL